MPNLETIRRLVSQLHSMATYPRVINWDVVLGYSDVLEIRCTIRAHSGPPICSISYVSLAALRGSTTDIVGPIDRTMQLAYREGVAAYNSQPVRPTATAATLWQRPLPLSSVDYIFRNTGPEPSVIQKVKKRHITVLRRGTK